MNLQDFNLREKWKQEWQNDIPPGGDLLEYPTNPQPDFHSLTRKQWTTESEHRMAEQPQICINGVIMILPHARNAKLPHKT